MIVSACYNFYKKDFHVFVYKDVDETLDRTKDDRKFMLE